MMTSQIHSQKLNPQKLVLMVQATRIQGIIWQAVLHSQNLAVIWESTHTHLGESLDHLKASGSALPDLLLIDMRIPNFNAYAFCRWCREYHPEIKIILTNNSPREITPSERQWAINQGAADLLVGFQQHNLVSSVAVAVKRTLEILHEHPLNNGALVSILLVIKRELGATIGSATPGQLIKERMQIPDIQPLTPQAVPPAFAQAIPPESNDERKKRAARLSQEAERVVFHFPNARNQLA
jgi:CheY-like chemotaxis protein